MASFNKLKSIKNEEEYELILKEIERLFDAVPGTTQAEQLEVLINLVETYEEEHYSLPQPSLMARLLYKLESRRLFPQWIRK